jgi:hypothetical protein
VSTFVSRNSSGSGISLIVYAFAKVYCFIGRIVMVC